MSKLALVNRVPRAYDQASIQEVVRLIETQGNKLAEGSIAARHGSMTAAPTLGSWVRGDTVDNVAPSVVSSDPYASYVIMGWICTVSGTPGTWVERRVMTANILASSPITNSLGADVACNNTANYFTGPSAAQGTSGTWFGSGTVTVSDTAGAANFSVKLWDGTTVIASARVNSNTANANRIISLSGFIASPAGNIRISVRDETSTSGLILFNASGNSKDSTITAFRIG